MKVRYTGSKKIEYKGFQHNPGEIFDVDVSDLTDKFEYVTHHKKNIELIKLKEMLVKLDIEMKDMQAYYNDYKKRVSALEIELNKTKVNIKEIKKVE